MASSKAEVGAIALALALVPGALFAQTLADCARLAADAERLACYDRVVGRVSPAQPAPVTPIAPMSSAAPAPAPVMPAAPATASVGASPVPVETAPPVVTPSPAEAQIGLPPVRKSEPEPTRIESRIVGHFEGWEGRTRFTLENGQVWENAGKDSIYSVAESPRVTITPGSFGSWLLSVEGLSARTNVRRVR